MCVNTVQTHQCVSLASTRVHAHVLFQFSLGCVLCPLAQYHGHHGPGEPSQAIGSQCSPSTVGPRHLHVLKASGVPRATESHTSASMGVWSRDPSQLTLGSPGRPEADRGCARGQRPAGILGREEAEQGMLTPPRLQLLGVGNRSRAVTLQVWPPPTPLGVCPSSVQQGFDSVFPDKPRAKPEGVGEGASVEHWELRASSTDEPSRRSWG